MNFDYKRQEDQRTRSLEGKRLKLLEDKRIRRPVDQRGRDSGPDGQRTRKNRGQNWKGETFAFMQRTIFAESVMNV